MVLKLASHASRMHDAVGFPIYNMHNIYTLTTFVFVWNFNVVK